MVTTASTQHTVRRFRWLIFEHRNFRPALLSRDGFAVACMMRVMACVTRERVPARLDGAIKPGHTSVRVNPQADSGLQPCDSVSRLGVIMAHVWRVAG